jgi:hypothetical protein
MEDREILVINEGFACKVKGNDWEEIWGDDGELCVTVRKGDRQKVASFSHVVVIAFDDEIQALVANVEDEPAELPVSAFNNRGGWFTYGWLPALFAYQADGALNRVATLDHVAAHTADGAGLVVARLEVVEASLPALSLRLDVVCRVCTSVRAEVADPSVTPDHLRHDALAPHPIEIRAAIPLGLHTRHL